VALDDFEEFACKFLQLPGAEVQIQARVVFALERYHPGVEMFVVDAECDFAEKLDEAAVCVVGKARVRGLLDQPLQGGFIEAEIEDRIHHPGHGHRRAGAHRNQQRVFAAAESLAGLLLQRRHMRLDFLHQTVRQTVGIEVGEAGLGGHGETRRHIQADSRHIAQAGALAAEQDLVVAVALFECVDVLVHDDASRN
jgi:hypothetical protein